MEKKHVRRRKEELETELERLLLAYECSRNSKNRSRILDEADKVAGELKVLIGWGKD